MFQLFNADCLEVMKDISSNSIDLILCDLPFGCLTNQTGKSTGFERPSHKGTTLEKKLAKQTGAACAWDIKIDLEAFWTEVRRIRKNDHTPTLHFCTTKYGFDLWESNKKEFRYDLVWDKGRGVSFLSANKMPMRSHEMVYVFSKAGAYYNRVDISGDFKPYTIGQGKAIQYGIQTKSRAGEQDGDGKRCVKSVIQNPTSSRKGGHPTEKPVDLYTFLIQRYCPEGGTVLDPTFGSGNSGRAAKALGRNYIGIEKNKEFFDKAKAILVSAPSIDAPDTP
jgi:site-specific DNA-methyltransferase (adenine-specific)